MGFFRRNRLERWSGERLLSVDRGLAYRLPQSPKQSWSSAPQREERTGFAPHRTHNPHTAQVATSPAPALEPGHPAVANVGIPETRVAESWSSVRQHEDRTRLATVDIRETEIATESWSSAQQRDDRTRFVASGTEGRSWTARAGVGAFAATLAGLALLLSAPVALAEEGSSAASPQAQAASPDWQDTEPPAGGEQSDATGSSSGNGSGGSNESSGTASTASTTHATGTQGQANAAPTAQTQAAPENLDAQGPTVGQPGVAVGSPGNEVDQQATVSAEADVGNDAIGGQTANQEQTGTAEDEDGTGSSSGENAGAGAGHDPQANQSAGQQLGNGQQADASATSAQNGAQNTNVTTLVDNPSPTGGVAQSNESTSEASASNDQSLGQDVDSGSSAPTGTAGETSPTQNLDATQDAGAAAQTTQDAENANVTVRIDSPGENGAVDQTNAASSSATATNSSETASIEGGEGDAPPADQSASAQATTSQSAGNENVSVRVFSPGDDGPVDQRNTASASASAGNSSNGVGNGASNAAANVDQDASNTNVSLRVNSPGNSGAVTQANSERATVNGVEQAGADESGVQYRVDTGTGDEVEFAVSVDGGNTDFAVAIESDSLETPSTPEWTWNWDLVWTPGTEPDCELLTSAGDEATTWDFDCDGSAAEAPSGAGGAASSSSSSASPPSGSITWTWTWTRASDPSFLWTWNKVIALSCACNWRWTWNWHFDDAAVTSSADDEEDSSSPATDAAEPSVVQTNVSSALALAGNAADMSQLIAQAQEGVGSIEDQRAEQIALMYQGAYAQAVSFQRDVHNYNHSTGGTTTQLIESRAVAEALADGAVLQVITQSQSGEHAILEQLAGQAVAVTEVAAAIAVSTQQQLRNWNGSVGSLVEQTISSQVTAESTVVSLSLQWTEQTQTGIESNQVQAGIQKMVVSQIHGAIAVGLQQQSRNGSRAYGGSVEQAAWFIARSVASSLSLTIQEITQNQLGDHLGADTLLQQVAWQEVKVLQSGIASAEGQQRRRNLYASPPPPAADSGGGSDHGQTPDGPAGAPTIGSGSIVVVAQTTVVVDAVEIERRGHGAAGNGSQATPSVVLTGSGTNRAYPHGLQVSSAPTLGTPGAKSNAGREGDPEEKAGESPLPTPIPAPTSNGVTAGSAGSTGSGSGPSAITAAFLLPLAFGWRRVPISVVRRPVLYVSRKENPG